MQIDQLLTLDRTQCAVEGHSKKRILEIISQLAAQQLCELQQATILEALTCRERLGSTGIGNGIALPHGRVDGLEKIIGFLLTSSHPLDFDALDDKPVDIFFVVLVPEQQTEEHLTTLAAIATKLSDKSVLKAMRKATNHQALFDAISREA